MKGQRWLALGLSVLMVATSTPIWAVPTMADAGTEQVESSSEAAEASEDVSEESDDATAEAEATSTATDNTTSETDATTDSADVGDSEETVAQSTSSEDVNVSLYSADSEEDSDAEDGYVEITFDANGGQKWDGDDEEAKQTVWTLECVVGETFGEYEGAYRKGYSFLGWSTDQNAATPEISKDDMWDASVPAEDTTLYAVWAKDVLVTFDANGGQYSDGDDEDSKKTTWT
ncbi:MAG: InlB B-repeat-containing protein, partial [Bilifractor sp.]